MNYELKITNYEIKITNYENLPNPDSVRSTCQRFINENKLRFTRDKGQGTKDEGQGAGDEL